MYLDDLLNSRLKIKIENKNKNKNVSRRFIKL